MYHGESRIRSRRSTQNSVILRTSRKLCSNKHISKSQQQDVQPLTWTSSTSIFAPSLLSCVPHMRRKVVQVGALLMGNKAKLSQFSSSPATPPARLAAAIYRYQCRYRPLRSWYCIDWSIHSICNTKGRTESTARNRLGIFVRWPPYIKCAVLWLMFEHCVAWA